MLTDITNDLIDARLRTGGAVHFTIPTWSMYPTLAPGDHVVVQESRVDELRPGDIVLARVGGIWLAHRLIGRRVVNGNTLYITKGDNALEADQAWQAAQLSGMIVEVQRNGRKGNLLSRRARWTGASLARLARVQMPLQRIRPRFARRVALKASRILLRTSAWLARWMV